MTTVWIVNKTENYDGLYVFGDELRARQFLARCDPISTTISEEVVMNDSAAAQFLIDEAASDE